MSDPNPSPRRKPARKRSKRPKSAAAQPQPVAAPDPDADEALPEPSAVPAGEAPSEVQGGERQGKPPVRQEEAAAKPSPAKPPVPQRPPGGPGGRRDPELLADYAWQIYLAELSEEGVALVDDKDARELARRCFTLAEIFLGEKQRHGRQ